MYKKSARGDENIYVNFNLYQNIYSVIVLDFTLSNRGCAIPSTSCVARSSNQVIVFEHVLGIIS